MSSIKIALAGEKANLSGFLDENSDLKPLKAANGKCTVNFKDVARVNSCGVREWVNLVTSIPAVAFTYEECPIVVVKQLNAVPDFMGKAKVSSFFAPYFCESCDKEAVKLIKTTEIAGDKPPESKCETCGKPMNFDAIPNQYLSFLKR